MITTTLDAAQILGVSQRQVQASIESGLLSAVKLGKTFGVYEHQVFALEKMSLSGRRWNQKTWEAALDLLSGLAVSTLDRTSKSRLKARLKVMSEAELVGRFLAGRVKLYRADRQQQRVIGSKIADELGLVGYGTSVIVSGNVADAARTLNLSRDEEGNVVAVQTSERHRAVLEALAYIAYGSAREESAGRDWITEQRERALAA